MTNNQAQTFLDEKMLPNKQKIIEGEIVFIGHSLIRSGQRCDITKYNLTYLVMYACLYC